MALEFHKNEIKNEYDELYNRPEDIEFKNQFPFDYNQYWHIRDSTKHFMFRWWWVDAWVNSSSGAACVDSFDTFEEAKNNLQYFTHIDHLEEVLLVIKN